MICSGNVVSLQGNTYKVMHVVCSVTCWLLPWIPVGVVLGSKSTPYRPWNMRLCFPIGSDSTMFFTTTFITLLSQGVGCTCLFFVVYKLFMVIEKAVEKLDRITQTASPGQIDSLSSRYFVFLVTTSLPGFLPREGEKRESGNEVAQLIWLVIS